MIVDVTYGRKIFDSVIALDSSLHLFEDLPNWLFVLA